MPIHEDDINEQTAALLDAATVPATIVNWGGDDAVSVQEWCAFFAELTGHDVPVDVVATPGTLRGSIADADRSPGDHRSVPGALEGRPARRVRGEVSVNVLVTGASSGIGAATAIAFAQRGATVGICARREDRLAEVLADVPGGKMWVVDLADLDGIDEFAATSGRGAGRHRRAGEQRRSPEASAHDDHDRRRRRERDGDQLLLAGAPHPGRAPPAWWSAGVATS